MPAGIQGLRLAHMNYLVQLPNTTNEWIAEHLQCTTRTVSRYRTLTRIHGSVYRQGPVSWTKNATKLLPWALEVRMSFVLGLILILRSLVLTFLSVQKVLDLLLDKPDLYQDEI